MSLVIVQDLALAYGKKTLFDEEAFTIGPTDRVGLVGANGTGKSTLLKILAGQLTPDVAKCGSPGARGRGICRRRSSDCLKATWWTRSSARCRGATSSRGG